MALVSGMATLEFDSGATIVLITHDPEIAEAAPRRVAIRDGLIGTDVTRPIEATA